MGYPLSTPPSRAPRWAGSTSDEYITYFMASSKPSKRPYPDSDSDSELLPSTFPHFIVLESLDEKQLTKLNPIKKTISGIVNPLSVKKLNNGTLLIEVDKKAYAENLLKMKTFAGLKIKVSPHLSLNSSKGVVRNSELSLCTLDEIKTYLKPQGVSDVKRISIKRNDEIINTNTYIFTFSRSQLPKEIKVGYNLIKINPYIPNPLRCYNCQKFGHHETKCVKSAVCKKCGESGSDHIELTCSNPIKCANCQSDHPADSRNCLVWKREKEINNIKFTQNISFPEARKIVQSQNQFPTKSYSQVAKSNTETKHNHSCTSCHTILEKLSTLPTLGVWQSGFRNSRKEEVVLSRLRIGHTYFTHSYILRQEDPPECTACQEIYSVRHVLIDCIDLGLIRPRFYNVPDVKTLFDTVSVDRILSFVKEVNLFDKI